MSNPISEFYDVIWTFHRGEETIDAISKGELTLEQYEEMLYNKRQAFDACIIDSVLNKINIGTIYKIIDRLDKVLCDDYRDFDFSKNDIYTKYHYIRHKHLAFAVNHSKDLITFEDIDRYNDGKDKEIEEMYLPIEKTYRLSLSENRLKAIYQYLDKEFYLDRDSSFERFKYCMTGIGKPTPRLSWARSKSALAYFIETFSKDDGRKWQKSEEVFGMHVENANMQNAKSPNPFKRLKEEIKNM